MSFHVRSGDAGTSTIGSSIDGISTIGPSVACSSITGLQSQTSDSCLGCSLDEGRSIIGIGFRPVRSSVEPVTLSSGAGSDNLALQ
ncbi:hypothetical protein Hdeb2414_s0009g00304801 [Helianthus debilis subsp. tardiflorus]